MEQHELERAIRRGTRGSVGYQITRAVLLCVVFIAAVLIIGLMLAD